MMSVIHCIIRAELFNSESLVPKSVSLSFKPLLTISFPLVMLHETEER